MVLNLEQALGDSDVLIQSVLEMTKSLDRTLFDDFVEKKAAAVNGIIRSGILDANIDWYEMPPPTGKWHPVIDRLAVSDSSHARG